MLTGKNLGHAIDEAIKIKGCTKKALADFFGVKPPSVQDWVRKGTIDKEKLPALWHFFRDSVGPGHWGLDQFPMLDSSDESFAARGAVTVREKSPGPFRAGSIAELSHDQNRDRRLAGKVNLVVMDVRASMGHGIERPSREDVVMSMVVDETWLRRHANFSHPDNLAILTGIGDSMDPTFEDGDPLLVDRSVTELKHEGIFVMSLNDRLYIKRLQQRPDGAFVMISDNKKYDSYVIKDTEREKLDVLGRVVMVWNARKI